MREVRTGELTCPGGARGAGPRGLEVRAWCGAGRRLGAERWAWGMGSGVGGGDTVPVPWDLRPHMCGEGIVAPGLLPLSTVPSPGTHALCSIGLNERGLATVEPGFGDVCDVP